MTETAPMASPAEKGSGNGNVSVKSLLRIEEYYKKYLLELILRQKPLPPSKDGRHVPFKPRHEKDLIDERTGHAYISNHIRSSRYTIYDFIPKQIIFQATRLSNFYFICIGIPQAIPGISTTGSYTTILPLLFFMLLTIVKEGYDDYKRHCLDKVENTSRTTALREALGCNRGQILEKKPWFHPGRLLLSKEYVQAAEDPDVDEDGVLRWTEIQWQEIRVGDVLKLKRDEPVPADIVLLYATGESELAYVDTMAMDGETNLKSKQALSVFQGCSNIRGIKACSAEFVTEDPNPNLYSFDGRVTINDSTVPLTLNEVIYRGSILRNTAFIIGMVVNTGEECKIRMNANLHPKAKKPRLEHYANQIVLSLVFYVIILTAGCSLGYWLWQRSTEQYAFYLYGATVDYKDIIIGFAIEFNNVIPLALYVSLEIVKVGQLLMLNRDVEMYDEPSNTPMKCNTNTILENLGQVNYILSDKTGTLTENVMKFRKMAVAGTAWLHETVERKEVTLLSEDEKGLPEPAVIEPERDFSSKWSPKTWAGKSQLQGTTANLVDYIRHNPESAFTKRAHDFILGMALCHTCLPEKRDGIIKYSASSPDEVALVEAAQDLGYLVVHRSSQVITLSLENLDGTEQNMPYEVLDVIEFSSDRKRMSIIVRCPDDRIWLICKGADSVLLPRLTQTSANASEGTKAAPQNSGARHSAAFGTRSSDITSSPKQYDPRLSHMSDRKFGLIDEFAAADDSGAFRRCFEHVHDFSTEGLRTLIYGHKFISHEDYCTWKKLYREAATAISNRQERIEAAADVIEQSLELLGASAIEDKLQQGVPETIEKLRRAHIKIWMLTGDKRETAINIAHSTHICQSESDMFVLDSSKGDLEGQMRVILEDIKAGCTHSVAVIDGHTLSVVEADPALKRSFYSLIPQFDSVICCRASPAQKAGIVKAIHVLVPGALTLAIGDGANDLAMIQASHVGVGISGKEGLQAARVADYSIAQFRFLQRLILVHGRWNYVRTAKFVLMTFWKEMFFYMMQALYQRYNGYTGTSLYESASLTVLNTLFTSLCVIIMGVFEQDLSADTLLAVPELYVYGQRNKGLNWPKYLAWTLGATIEGVVVWLICWQAYGVADFTGDEGLFALGDLVFSVGIIWTNWKLFFIETHHKTRIVFICFSITFGGWWLWNIFLAEIYAPSPNLYDVRGGFTRTFGRDPIWWLTLLLCLTVLATGELAYIAVRRIVVRSLERAKGGKKGGLWGGGDRDDGRDEKRWDPAVWQEIETDPLLREKLRSLVSTRDGDSNSGSDSSLKCTTTVTTAAEEGERGTVV